MTMLRFPTPPHHDAAEALRSEVRAFLAEELAARPPLARADSWNGFDRDFSRKLGQRGWLGMTWPKQYGGHERSAFERYVIVEETLAAGAPVAAHWIADRQSGPSLLKYGTEEHAIGVRTPFIESRADLFDRHPGLQLREDSPRIAPTPHVGNAGSR